jgi:hypothetical protein
MIYLLIITAAGFVLSALVHVLMLLNIYQPSRGEMILLSVGGGIMIYIAIFIKKHTRGRSLLEDFNKEMFKACPRWMRVSTGLLIMYALVGLGFFALKRYLHGGEGAAETGTGDFTGYWMALYALAFSIIYPCMRMRKRTRGDEDHQEPDALP